jgi:hypothetical protein
MYIVHNLTNRTVVIADLHVEIGPRKILDLELVADRVLIDSSQDLKRAIFAHTLALTRHSIIQTNVQPIDTRSESLNEEQITRIVKQAIADELKNQPAVENSIKKAITSNMSDLVSSIRDQINRIQITPEKDKNDAIGIDPKRFAELSQKTVEKLSDEIKTGGQNQPKQVRIINAKNITDLANEID